MKKLVLFFITLLPFQSIGQAILIDTTQSLEKIDSTLYNLADTMFTKGYADYSQPSSEDIFITNLKCALRDSKTFNYKFPLLSAASGGYGIRIKYSNDGLLRVFDWLSPQSGTMQDWPAIFQAKNHSGKVIVLDTKDGKEEGFIPGTNFMLLSRLPATNQQLYLSFGGGHGSTILPYDIYQGFEVTDSSINDSVKLFNPDSTISNILFIDYESTWYNGSQKQDIPECIYDEKTLTITYPEITGTDKPLWTGKLKKLKFNGEYFTPTK